jgi:hypothetical protein
VLRSKIDIIFVGSVCKKTFNSHSVNMI